MFNKIKTIFKKINPDFSLIFITIFLIILGVASNIRQENTIDESKLPEKVESERLFQRWITNLKNKKVIIDADEFNLKEETEIYNTKWIKISSIEEEGKQEEFNTTIENYKNIKGIVYSPSEREFLDYRNIVKDTISPEGNYYQQNEVRFYGQKEDKIIEARILDCSLRANCYFDRAYFLSNDVFVITEFSRNIDKKDVTTPICPIDQICTYTIKLHLVDLINNSKLTYESKPLELNLEKLKPEL